MNLKLAIVQPITHAPPDDELNVQDAVQFVGEAARLGADLVRFPRVVSRSLADAEHLRSHRGHAQSRQGPRHLRRVWNA